MYLRMRFPRWDVKLTFGLICQVSWILPLKKTVFIWQVNNTSIQSQDVSQHVHCFYWQIHCALQITDSVGDVDMGSFLFFNLQHQVEMTSQLKCRPTPELKSDKTAFTFPELRHVTNPWEVITQTAALLTSESLRCPLDWLQKSVEIR